MIVCVKGCRYCGKSTRADRVARNFERLHARVRLLDASSIVGSVGEEDVGKKRTSREIDAIVNLSRNDERSLYLVVDNTEILLAYAPEEPLRRLARAVEAGTISLVLVRNRFVNEQDGWFVKKEALLGPFTERIELEAFAGDEGLAVAASFFPNEPEVQREYRAGWLLEWSGGLPGLMRLLKPSSPDWPQKETPPRDLERLVADLVRIHGLERPGCRRVLEAAVAGVLPAPPVIKESLRDEVGLLVALGILKPNYAWSTSPFQGRLWMSVAERCTGEVTSVSVRQSDRALELEMLLDGSGAAETIAEGLGCPAGHGNLALALELARWTTSETSSVAVPVEDILAEHLGAAGLRRVVRASGRTPTAIGAKLLAEQVVEIAGCAQ